jgi:hypothetical protein
MTAIDGGQGDSIFLVLPDGHKPMVDAGGLQQASRVVAAWAARSSHCEGLRRGHCKARQRPRANHDRSTSHLPERGRGCLRRTGRFRAVAQDLPSFRRPRYSLFSRELHRMRDEGSERKARPEARFYIVCGTPELDGAWNDAPLYSFVERVQSQARESCRRDRAQLFRLQFYQDSPYTSDESGHGRWRHRSPVERGGLGSPLASLRAAKGGKSGIGDSWRQGSRDRDS